MISFTGEEKERIFVGRTQAFYPKNWEEYVELVSHEKWTREQMVAYNFAKRLEMLRYAYEKSPFYKRHYDALGFRPEDVKTEADWEQVPIITKAHLREFGEEMIIESERKHLNKEYTGGSTGVPCPTYGDMRGTIAIRWRGAGWATGRAIGEVYPTPRQTLGQDTIYFMRLTDEREADTQKGTAVRYPKRVFWYDSQATRETLEACVQTICSMPEESYIMSAYTGSLYELAAYCVEQKIEVPRPLGVSVGSSILTPSVRTLIEQVFRCPVVDRYGTMDFGRIAQGHQLNREQPEVHYVFSDLCYLELVDGDGNCVKDGEVGLTVATSFTNRVAPLIRYQQGDWTYRVTTPDPLGLPFDRIGTIQGRETDWMETKDGLKIHPYCGMFNAYPLCVKGFQTRQKEPGKVRLLVIPNEANPNMETELAYCVQKYRESFKGTMDVTVERVSTIEHDAGKLRAFVREK